jgi:hypothetical protein
MVVVGSRAKFATMLFTSRICLGGGFVHVMSQRALAPLTCARVAYVRGGVRFRFASIVGDASSNRFDTRGHYASVVLVKLDLADSPWAPQQIE